MDKLRIIGFIVLIIVLVVLGLGVTEIAKRISSEEPTLNERALEISGSWLSDQDPSYVLVLDEAGAYEDIYDGEVVDAGQWDLLEDLSSEGWEQTPDFQGALFLKKTTPEGDSWLYAVTSMTLDQLELIYLQGTALRFSRIE